jgi:branched-chain amino acid transport system substrate-binding protein
MSQKRHLGVKRRDFVKSIGALAAASTLGFPYVSRAAGKVIRVGVPTILSGRVAQVGMSSLNAINMEVKKFNDAGGLGGRLIEIISRDSKGKPDEAANNVKHLINSEGCEIIIDAEASSGSFAVQEVIRETGVLCLHTVSETSSLTADPKIRVPSAFRVARQGIHDAVVSASYAATIAKKNKLRRWMSCSPDYAYGRDNTSLFLDYLKRFYPDMELVGETWPKLFQADYTENITKILQVQPDAMYSALWGGDLVSFVDQSSIYALFSQTKLFATNLADYTTMSAIKNLPDGIHSSNRYLKAYPATKANHDWADIYRAAHKDWPTNWAWENKLAVEFLVAALTKANSTDATKMSEVIRGLTVKSPFGHDGTVTMRGDDQTIINYAIGWGATLRKEPFMKDVFPGDWKTILEYEAEWKKKSGYL